MQPVSCAVRLCVCPASKMIESNQDGALLAPVVTSFRCAGYFLEQIQTSLKAFKWTVALKLCWPFVSLSALISVLQDLKSKWPGNHAAVS